MAPSRPSPKPTEAAPEDGPGFSSWQTRLIVESPPGLSEEKGQDLLFPG